MTDNHDPGRPHKANQPDHAEITVPEVKKAALLGATQGLARSLVALVIWGLRNHL